MATYLDHKAEGTVTTTDATVTTCCSYTLADETTVIARARVIGKQSSSTNSGGYVRTATVKRDSAGAATLVGAVTDGGTHEDTAGWDCTIDVNGNDLRVRVTGAAGVTVVWMTVLEIVVLTP